MNYDKRQVIFYSLLFCLSIVSLSGCSKGMNEAASAVNTTNQPSTAGDETTPPVEEPAQTPQLAVSPMAPQLDPGGSVTFTVSGGVPPYTLSLVSGTGVFTDVTIYKVSDVYKAEDDQILIVDSSGLQLTVFVDIRGVTEKLAIHRFARSNDHLFTLDKAEGDSIASFSYEGIAFSVFKDGSTIGTIPLYRCYDAGKTNKHVVSKDPKCENMTLESTYGYVYATSQPNSAAVYRLKSPTTGDSLATIYPNLELTTNYTDEGILGYAPTN